MTIPANISTIEMPCFYVGVLQANIDMSVSSTYQFSAVDNAAASGTGVGGPSALVVPASSGAAILGVLQNNPALGVAGDVMVHGITKMQAGGTIAAGAIVATNAAGQAVTAASTNYGIGKAIQAGVTGNIISILLFGYGKQ